MRYWVYMHINKTNGKKYVGTTHSENPKTRWQNGKGYPGNKQLTEDIDKYGWKNFDHCYMECRSEEEMYRLEQHYIEKYQTTNPELGYNIVFGGKYGLKYKNRQSKNYQALHREKIRRILCDIPPQKSFWSDIKKYHRYKYINKPNE